MEMGGVISRMRGGMRPGQVFAICWTQAWLDRIETPLAFALRLNQSIAQSKNQAARVIPAGTYIIQQ